MLSLVIMLAVASTIVELTFAANFPRWRQAANNNKAINLFISIVISFILGMAFGAAGLIAMSAAIISTVMSIPGYAFLHWAYDSPRAKKHNGNLLKHYADKWKQVLTDFVNIVYKVLRIITFPIWATRAVILKFNNIKAKHVRH
jgi:hypothetical protein